MSQIADNASFSLLAEEAGFYPIEEWLRMNVRGTIEAVCKEELAAFLGRLAECKLVELGVTPEGKKVLLRFQVGVRESTRQLGANFWLILMPVA